MKSSTPADVLFLDTWGWLVLADARDPAHAKSVALRRARTALVTTDYVLDETFTRLFAKADFAAAREFSQAILAAGESGLLRIERITVERFDSAYRMRLRFRDKPSIPFTDLTSFVVMKELGLRDVLTADARFSQVQMGFRVLP